MKLITLLVNETTGFYQQAAKRYGYHSDSSYYAYEDYDTKVSRNQAIQPYQQQSSFYDYIVEGRH